MRTIKEMKGNMSDIEFSIACASSITFWAEKVVGAEVKPYHKEWFDLVRKNKRLAIQSFTGSGKSYTLGVIYPLWLLYHNPKFQVVIVSKTMAQALIHLETIASVIEDNELLMQMVPENKRAGRRWFSRSVNDAHIELSGGRKFYVRPYNDSIKGIHVNYLLGDEVASYEDKDIWYRFVVTRVARKNGTVVAISTPEDPSDLMQELQKNEEYIGKTYAVLDEQGNPTWPEAFAKDKVEKLRRELGKARFEREYMCNPKAMIENGIFAPEDVMSCVDPNSSLGKVKSDDGIVVIGADFAISTGDRADYDVYWVIKKVGTHIYILDGYRDRGVPIEEKVRRLVSMAKSYPNLEVISVDESGIGAAIMERLISAGLPVVGQTFQAANRRSMLMSLVTYINQRKISIPYNRADEKTWNIIERLISEMFSFKETKTPSGMYSFDCSADHDDAVIALAIAVNAAKDYVDYADGDSDGWPI